LLQQPADLAAARAALKRLRSPQSQARQPRGGDRWGSPSTEDAKVV